MFGKPKRNIKNGCCGRRGRCSCQRRDNAVAARRPHLAPRDCTRVCRPGKGTCGRTMHGGVCPCPYC